MNIQNQPLEVKETENHTPGNRGTEHTKTKRVYPRMLCGLHIDADEAARWWKAEVGSKLPDDHSGDGSFRMWLDSYMEELNYGCAIYVPRDDDDSYYDFLAVSDEFHGEFETDNPIEDRLVTDEKHLVPGDRPSVRKMKAILDELKVRYTGFRCYYWN